MKELRVFPVSGVPSIEAGDPLAQILVRAIGDGPVPLEDGDVIAVCQKVVSKAEGRVVPLEDVTPSPRAQAFASEHGKDARVVELVLRESKRILRMERGVIIAETPTGLVCANAGVDRSNAPGPQHAVLLPRDPDGSARALHGEICRLTGRRLGVVITDTFGRPWREGLVDVAIGLCGLKPLIDFRGQRDWTERTLEVTVMALADQIAAAAGLVMGKSEGLPAAILRGAGNWLGEGRGSELIRPAERDLFR